MKASNAATPLWDIRILFADGHEKKIALSHDIFNEVDVIGFVTDDPSFWRQVEVELVECRRCH